ncbi:MAG TPA: hypothetical protein VK453_15145 [Micromonosporaceae bacterium]|nr:hypothetical protein [Micromonosporaceae bacterium]
MGDVSGSDPRLSRRALLAAVGAGLAGAGSLGGCRLPSTGLTTSPARWQAAPDPLVAFLAATIGLADRYDAVITAVPALTQRLAPIRDAHRAHVTVLARHVGLVGSLPPGRPDQPAATPATPAPTAPTPSAPAPPTPATPTDPAAAIASLRSAEDAAVQAAVAACLTAPRWHAALLGSIAAGRACHLAVLT